MKSERKVVQAPLPYTSHSLGIGHVGVSTEHTGKEGSQVLRYLEAQKKFGPPSFWPGN